MVFWKYNLINICTKKLQTYKLKNLPFFQDVDYCPELKEYTDINELQEIDLTHKIFLEGWNDGISGHNLYNSNIPIKENNEEERLKRINFLSL